MNTLQDLVATPSLWLRQGADADVALLSRVRLSRNLSGWRFPGRASADERAALAQQILAQSQQTDGLQDGIQLDLDGLDETPRRALAERQLVPRAFMQTQSQRHLVLAADESQSFLVNGDDHLQIQAQVSGLDLQAAFEACDALDVELDSRLDFAYSETYGFLTSRPSRAGTGLRASVLLHLPGLCFGDGFDARVEELRRRKIRMEAFRLDRDPGDNSLFLVSNAETLGRREGEIVRDLDTAVRDLLDREQEGRQRLFSGAQSLLADRIWRSYGILSQARLLKAAETLRHASRLLLGVQLGLLEIPGDVLVELFALSQDAHTQMRMQAKASGAVAASQEVEEWRAERVRNELQGLNG